MIGSQISPNTNQGFPVYEFTFRCESCKREYEFKDDKVVEKKRGRDPIAESEAIERSLLLAAINRRCDKCGGPITRSHGVEICFKSQGAFGDIT